MPSPTPFSLILAGALAAMLSPVPRPAGPLPTGPCLTTGQSVRLAGRLHRQTFPGPPNYESIAGGDLPETGYYLFLSTPACVEGDTGLLITSVQVILDSAGYAELRPWLTHPMTLSGQLLLAETGHHHTPVLLDLHGPVRCRGDEYQDGAVQSPDDEIGAGCAVATSPPQ